jgi:acyl-CoA reductase-like NAD-dependent aldehyde dehydrogenase
MSSPLSNFIDNQPAPPISGLYMDVTDPATNAACGSCPLSDAADVAAAVAAADKAFPAWSTLTMKARAALMLKFHALVRANAGRLADLIVLENGKNRTEALADVAKGNETVEWACTLPSVAQGRRLDVSRGINCRDERRPLGVVAAIAPFNFPFMVPMWTVPIALVMGNTVVLKPSEKVPLTMAAVAGLFVEAGFPPGAFNMVHGSAAACTALMSAPAVKAVTFVGSSPIASLVSNKCRSLNKRVLALGGAKNHLVALPDCSVQDTARDVVTSA